MFAVKTLLLFVVLAVVLALFANGEIPRKTDSQVATEDARTAANQDFATGHADRAGIDAQLAHDAAFQQVEQARARAKDTLDAAKARAEEVRHAADIHSAHLSTSQSAEGASRTGFDAANMRTSDTRGAVNQDFATGRAERAALDAQHAHDEVRARAKDALDAAQARSDEIRQAAEINAAHLSSNQAAGVAARAGVDATHIRASDFSGMPGVNANAANARTTGSARSNVDVAHTRTAEAVNAASAKATEAADSMRRAQEQMNRANAL
jgi:hypothetical protein